MDLPCPLRFTRRLARRLARRLTRVVAPCQYTFTRTNPFYRPESRSLLPLLQPLFYTSFLLDAFLADQGCWAAQSVVITSASSKTAIALATYAPS